MRIKCIFIFHILYYIGVLLLLFYDFQTMTQCFVVFRRSHSQNGLLVQITWHRIRELSLRIIFYVRYHGHVYAERLLRVSNRG